MGDVTIVTASLPERAPLLSEAIQSVTRQIVPTAHLIGIDKSRNVAAVRNSLIKAADTKYVGFLDDDDTLDPIHVSTLLHHAWNLDVIVPHCRFNGGPLPDGYYNRPYDREDLRAHGIFPITVLARREAVLDCGGFPEDEQWEDWKLWNKMADAGCRFGVVPTVTWTYFTDNRDRRTNQILGIS